MLVAKPIARLKIVAKRNLDAALRASPKVNIFDTRCNEGSVDDDEEKKTVYICLTEGQ